MFKDDEIQESIRRETSRRAGRPSPEQKEKWIQFEQRLREAIEDRDEGGFWEAATDFGIVPGSPRYEGLRKWARNVF